MAAYWPYMSLPCGCETVHKCPHCRLCRSCFGCDCADLDGAELADTDPAYGPP